MNTASASFNTTVRQMTEASQWPKCPNKKNCAAWSCILPVTFFYQTRRNYHLSCLAGFSARELLQLLGCRGSISKF